MSKHIMAIEVDVPDGYVLTGEYRPPTKTECYLNEFGDVYVATSDWEGTRRFIVRKAWQPPKWLPNGCWVYRNHFGDWRITDLEPVKHHNDDGYDPQSQLLFDAHSLAKLHGDTFTPPPVNKIQVRHATTD